MVAKLPIELVRLIVTFVREDNNSHETLAACSVVCRSWNDICLDYLFKSIIIHHESLTRLCYTASHISECIHNLCVSFDNQDCFANDWNFILNSNPESWGRFKNLRTLCLENGIAPLTDYRPSPLSVTTFLLAAPCLKELTFRGWTFARASAIQFMLELSSKTLEQLSFDGVSFQEDHECIAPPIRMDSLRRLGFPPRCHPRIECPNLQSLIVRIEGRERWVIPSWVPSGLHDLTLHATARDPIPDLGKNIQPVHFMVNLCGPVTYFRFMNWVRVCVDRLPFPDRLRRLTINIEKYLFGSEVCYPQPRDYENILQVLQQIRGRGVLEHIDLKVTIRIEEIIATPDWTNEQRREVKKLKQGLGPLFEANILHVAFALHRCFDGPEEDEILMGWDGCTVDGGLTLRQHH
ncbi:hypothetical protein PLEOSDRAFT_1108702 [Pleurotus ostreatus PC15]|uniref:F-box domain-containing protein n=1 Tax=Pleurotus ostreatus (strain PC15) TaxID=1137138 RepID=A0A067N5E2_PLEO1|nr:hypothetical protein PLEOSDRAFT_1108702 [Pleurotus ostreatus PC15]